MNTLEGMTQTKWDALSPAQKDAIRDNSGLTDQLRGLEGWRVEALDAAGETPRRFYVGKSTGWRPCHLEIARRTSSGGSPARNSYFAIRRLEKRRY